MSITEQERRRRMHALKGAEAINAIAGGPISDEAQQLFLRWANGEITREEMTEALIKRHKRIAGEMRHSEESQGVRRDPCRETNTVSEKQRKEIIPMSDLKNGAVFGLGQENSGYAQYFTGTSYLNLLSTQGVVIGNVTFEPGCRNHWHIHRASRGGGQILLVTGGRGWYQEWGKPARELHAGDVVNIPAGVRHWHGAAKDSWFVHLAVEVPGEDAASEWLEAVTDEEYEKLP